jgi:prolyl-tRNA editing enzyme YbaK/EbsC (Cys-tRNA(Pro) deacylase)
VADDLSPSAKRVQDALVALGVDCRVVEMPATTRTAKDAASAIGCRVEQICKSLVFRAKQTDRPVLVIASGPNRVDEAVLGAALGETIERATADYVRDRTGFAIGGVPPVGHSDSIKTFIDESLMAQTELWAAAGYSTPMAILSPGLRSSSDTTSATAGLPTPTSRRPPGP